MSAVNPAAAQSVALPATPSAQTQQNLPMSALASPYDGTVPTSLGTMAAGQQLAGQVPMLTGLGAGVDRGAGRQLNATNQTAYAPNGDVNQHVVNENQYTNRYYNIIVPNSAMGGWGGVGGLFGGWNTPGNAFVDPQTGVMYVQRDTGITGWFKRLFRGY